MNNGFNHSAEDFDERSCLMAEILRQLGMDKELAKAGYPKKLNIPRLEKLFAKIVPAEELRLLIAEMVLEGMLQVSEKSEEISLGHETNAIVELLCHTWTGVREKKLGITPQEEAEILKST